MPKTLAQFVCSACNEAHSKWSGRCNFCGAWNSLAEQIVAKTKAAASLKPASLGQLSSVPSKRLKTSVEEIDQVLGGGIVPGSLMLLAGDPGVGKSTLSLQLAGLLSRSARVLYVSAEESPEQLTLRARRLGLSEHQLDVVAATDAMAVAGAVAGSYDLAIVDSIQMLLVDGVNGAAGGIAQITASTQVLQQAAKSSGCAVLLIGHVTKDGQIAGPKILEHLVDVVLQLEGESYGHFRALRANKNRFGAVGETAIFEMVNEGLAVVQNPSAALLSERQVAPGSVVFVGLEGNRPLLVEVQALVSPSVFGYPKRTSAGFDINRLNLLAAVLTRRAGINLSQSDIYVNIVGGLKVTEPAADLAIILSIASAFKNKSLPEDFAVFGEVGLSGEVRSVSGASARLKEASKLGFSKVITPGTAKGPAIIAVKTASEAIASTIKSI